MYRRVRRVRARSLGRGAAAAPGTRPASVSGRVDVSTPRSVRAGAVVARLPCGRVRAARAPSGRSRRSLPTMCQPNPRLPFLKPHHFTLKVKCINR